MENKIKNLKQGQRIAFISAFVSIFLAILKGTVGYLFNSSVLIADAFHSGADLLTHAASGFGLWIAASGKTKKFPYGLYRAETLACLVVGGFIVLAGFELFREGYQKLFYLDSIESFPIFPVAASIVSSMAALLITKMEFKVGKSIGSISLIANSQEAFLDIFTSLIVLLGILLSYFKILYAEGAVIILISILLFKIGLESIYTSFLILMDANLDPKLQCEIEKKVNEIYGVKGISNVKIRQSGPFKMIECVIHTKPSLSLYKAHELANNVEDIISGNYEHIESVFIHVEPIKEKTVIAMIPVQNIDDLSSKIHNHFARAPYFIIFKLSDNKIEIEDFYLNQFLDEQKHIGVKISRVIIKHKIDLLLTCNIGEIAFHILKNNLIDIYKTEEGLSVKETINRYRLKKLEPLISPTHSVEESLVLSYN
ncbi:MAG: cation diffusion facilitator family transporter [Desulfobacterales bacterium]|nr:cation diffusion facilitator family transporter [Desulfobacterales bacterium]MBF0398897.1 cation diffusion facilitator family transporter [Desulfobacterales bacterium]